MGKAGFSGVQFPDHGGPAVISAPRGQMSTKTDRSSEFPKCAVCFSLVSPQVWEVLKCQEKT